MKALLCVRGVLSGIGVLGCLCALTPGCGADSKQDASAAGGAGRPAAGAESVPAGTAGAAGEGGGAGATTAGSGGIGDDASVLERNRQPSREGHFIEPALSLSALARFGLDTDFAANFEGNMYASPLYLANGPHDKGVFFAVTTSNDVIA